MPTNGGGGMHYSRGPLSMEMGAITGAVDDLVSGYESLVTALPDVAQRVSDIQNGTEDMAKRLEDRMRYLIDGYEYLDSVSAQIPPALQKMAASHRRNLMEAAELLGTGDREDLDRHERDLNNLKGELKSMSYERVVMDVLTRQAIKDSRRAAPPPISRGRLAGAAPGPGNSKTESLTSLGGVNDPIHIGKFNSDLSTPGPSRNAQSLAVHPTQNPHKIRQRYDIFAAQSSAGATVVPSVKMGSLPKELQHIKSVPSNTVIGDTRKRLIPKSIYPAKKRAHSGSRQRSRSPPRPESKTVARSMNNATNAAVEGLRANMENSAQQMAEMRNRLENAETRRAEDQDYTDRKLDDIKELLLDKEKENRQILDQMKAKTDRLGKKRVVVETIADDTKTPAQYKVLPVSGAAAALEAAPMGTTFSAAPIDKSTVLGRQIALSSAPERILAPLRTTHPDVEPSVGFHAANWRDISSQGDSKMIVIDGRNTTPVCEIPQTVNAEIAIADPSYGTVQMGRRPVRCDNSSALPNLTEDRVFLNDNPMVQHNRPLQPYISRVIMGGKIMIEAATCPVLVRVSPAVSDNESRDVKASCRDQMDTVNPVASGALGSADEAKILALDSQHNASFGMESMLLDLVKGMVIHQQQTIESQAELMKTVLLSAEGVSRGMKPATSGPVYSRSNSQTDGNVNNSDDGLVLEDIDGIPSEAPRVRTMMVTEVKQPKQYNTAFGRLLTMGPAFAAGTKGESCGDSAEDSDEVLPTLHSAAARAEALRNLRSEQIAARAHNSDDAKCTPVEVPTRLRNNRNEYPLLDEAGSSRLASLRTIKHIAGLSSGMSKAGQAREITTAAPVGAHPAADFVNAVMTAVKEAIGLANESSGPAMTNPHLQRPRYVRADTQRAKEDSDNAAVRDPRYLEQLMIEECVERAVRAALPSHLTRDQRHFRPQHSEEHKEFVALGSAIAEDTENEWMEHDKQYGRNNIKSRPTGGFHQRVKSDLSGRVDETGDGSDEAMELLGKAQNKIVAGPGGLVYYGQRDGWANDRCAGENEYHSYRQSKTAYQRYINRNGMNHQHITEPAAEQHYRGSDEEGFEDSEAHKYPATSGAAISHAYRDAEVMKHLNAGSAKAKSELSKNAEGRVVGCEESIAGIIQQDMDELRAHRRKAEEDAVNDTRSSISEYSSGDEKGGILAVERPNRIPQEAIELDYVRRANQSRPKSLTRTVRSEADYGYSRSEKAKPIRARRDVENLVGLGIPTPLVSKQLGHQATAEVATMGIDISDRYVSMIAHDRSYPSDSDDEKNVPYPAPFLSNYHAIPARQRQVSCRQQAEPRSRFLHNLQPVSDDSSFPNSPTSSFDVGNCRKRSDYYVTSLKSKQQYLGNIEKASQAHELISNCSTGTPASSTDMSSKRARQRSRGQSKAVPDKSNASARSVSSDDESGVGNGNGISRPAIQQQIADEIVRQPVIFMTKLRLGPLPAEPCHAADTGRKSRDSNQSSLSSAASNYDDESALVEDRSDADEMYYSSMDSSVTVSSTSQSMRQYSRNKW